MPGPTPTPICDNATMADGEVEVPVVEEEAAGDVRIEEVDAPVEEEVEDAGLEAILVRTEKAGADPKAMPVGKEEDEEERVSTEEVARSGSVSVSKKRGNGGGRAGVMEGEDDDEEWGRLSSEKGQILF